MACAYPASSYEQIGITREPDAVDPARNGPPVVVGLI
jgi:hypothetical protein